MKYQFPPTKAFKIDKLIRNCFLSILLTTNPSVCLLPFFFSPFLFLLPSSSQTNKRSASDSRTREVQLHQQLHEDMSEEILHMARGLKKNALRQRDKLDKTSAQLEEAEHHLESNVANAKTRNKQAKVSGGLCGREEAQK